MKNSLASRRVFSFYIHLLSCASSCPLNNENTGYICNIVFIFATSLFLLRVGQLLRWAHIVSSLSFPPPSHFLLFLTISLYLFSATHSLCYTEHSPKTTALHTLMSLSQHLSTDPRQGGPCAADLLWQWPEGRGLWNFLDVQSCCCHQDCPLWLCCQQRLWWYVWQCTADIKRVSSWFFVLTAPCSLTYTCNHLFSPCLARASVSVAEETIWDTRVWWHQWGAGEGSSQWRPGQGGGHP